MPRMTSFLLGLFLVLPMMVQATDKVVDVTCRGFDVDVDLTIHGKHHAEMRVSSRVLYPRRYYGPTMNARETMFGCFQGEKCFEAFDPGRYEYLLKLPKQALEKDTKMFDGDLEVEWVRNFRRKTYMLTCDSYVRD